MNDMAYGQRKSKLIKCHRYFTRMIDALNTDDFFTMAGVRFSSHSNNYHFVERFIDRKIDISIQLPIFYQFILKHRCEMVYYSKLENRPVRMELVVDDVVLGLSCSNGTYSFHTAMDRKASRVKKSPLAYRIYNNKHYYE